MIPQGYPLKIMLLTQDGTVLSEVLVVGWVRNPEDNHHLGAHTYLPVVVQNGRTRMLPPATSWRRAE